MVCTNGGSAPSRLWPRLEQPGQVRQLGGGAGWEAEAPAPLPESRPSSACSAFAQPPTHWDSAPQLGRQARQAASFALTPCLGSPHRSLWLLIVLAHCSQVPLRSHKCVSCTTCPALSSFCIKPVSCLLRDQRVRVSTVTLILRVGPRTVRTCLI